MTDDPIVWIVGRHTSDSPDSTAWEFFGVYADEAQAIAACRLPYDFVGPARMNERPPEATTEWPGAYFPKNRPQ